MVLMISIIVITFLLLVITCLKRDNLLYHIKFELSIKGLKLEFKTKEKGSHPPKD